MVPSPISETGEKVLSKVAWRDTLIIKCIKCYYVSPRLILPIECIDEKLAGMTEVLMGRDPSREMPSREVSSSSVRSGPPRYEAFLMTGEKMLNLDHKISPRYAEVYFIISIGVIALLK